MGVLATSAAHGACFRDGQLGVCCGEESERDITFPSCFAKDEAPVCSWAWNGERQKLPDMNLTSHMAACDNVTLNLWEEVGNDPDGEDGEDIMEEVTYRLQGHSTYIHHYSEKDTEVSAVETWASRDFNKRKAAMQVMNGLVQQEGGTKSDSISAQASDSDDELLGKLFATSTVINAISPPPHAPTSVGALACSDKNVPTQAN